LKPPGIAVEVYVVLRSPTIVPASIIMGAMESLLIITGTMGAGKTSDLKDGIFSFSMGSLSRII
jgi:hypothetical protein